MYDIDFWDIESHNGSHERWRVNGLQADIEQLFGAMSTPLAIGMHFIGTEESVDMCYVLISGPTLESCNLAEPNFSEYICCELVN